MTAMTGSLRKYHQAQICSIHVMYTKDTALRVSQPCQH